MSVGQQTVEHAQYVSRFNQNQPQQQGQYGQQQLSTIESRQGWRNNQINQCYGWRNNQNKMHHPSDANHSREKGGTLEQALTQILTSHTALMNKTKEIMQHQATQ